MNKITKLLPLIFLPNALFAQSGNSSADIYMMILIGFAISVVGFLVMRVVVLWYFKINISVDEQMKTNEKLDTIIKNQNILIDQGKPKD